MMTTTMLCIYYFVVCFCITLGLSLCCVLFCVKKVKFRQTRKPNWEDIHGLDTRNEVVCDVATVADFVRAR